ncbi:MAG: 4-(cytidine 5'-diphospho)-2-C-methyl-D-erythritol kinase [Ktedonobacteraceae bacterium]
MSDVQQSSRIPAHGTTCFVRSYAKINLTLDVLGKRADGYHELATIMQMVDLYDTLCLTTLDENRVSIVSTQPKLSSADNLAVRAAQAIRQHLSLTQGLHIELHKRIPMAAGLGGGSSNAAAVLLALQQWWQLPLSMEDMLGLAASLGSDVPFFLTEGLALCEGRGERLTPLSAYWPASMRWLLLVKPAISVSTATVFRNLPASDYTDGVHTRAVYTVLLAKGEPFPEDMHNGLERGVLQRYPQVAQARADTLRAGASFVRLSGSGPTLFAPFSELASASQAQQRLHDQGYEVYLTRAIHPTSGTICIFY